MIESIEQLKRLNKRELQRLYQRFFTSADGQILLEDLKMQCFHYHYTNGPRDEGKNDVIKYILDRVQPLDESIYDNKQLEEMP